MNCAIMSRVRGGQIARRNHGQLLVPEPNTAVLLHNDLQDFGPHNFVLCQVMLHEQ